MNTFLMDMINISIMSSVFIIAVLIFRKVFKKAPKLLIMLMWAAVAVRLLCPVTINTKFGLLPEKPIDRQEKTVPAAKSRADAPADKQVVYVFMGNEDLQLVRHTPVKDEEKTTPENVTQTTKPDVVPADRSGAPVAEKPVSVSSDGSGKAVMAEPVATTVDVNDVKEEKSVISISMIVQIAYCAGVLGMITYGFVGYVRIKRRCSVMIPICKGSNIYICDDVKTGFIIDIFRPKIILPSGLDDKTREHVINHERTHLKHKDNYWKPLGYLVLSLNWFNPLVWVAYICFVNDMELFCDESVIKRYNKDQIFDYSIALLNLSTDRVSMASLAFGEVNVKERIKSITTYKKPALIFASAATAVALVLTGCLMTNSTSKEKEKTTESEDSAEESVATIEETTVETTKTTDETEETSETTTVETTEETVEDKKQSASAVTYNMKYTELSGDTLADGVYLLSDYQFDNDHKGGTFDVSSYYYLTEDEVKALKAGDVVSAGDEEIKVEKTEEYNDHIIINEYHNSLGLQENGLYYLEDDIGDVSVNMIGKSKHIAIADNVAVYDETEVYGKDENKLSEYSTIYGSLADFDSVLKSDKAWCMPFLHAVVKDGIITEIYVNPLFHQQWRARTYNMQYTELSGDTLADGEYLLDNYQIDRDFKGGTFDVNSYYYLPQNVVDHMVKSLNYGDSVIVGDKEIAISNPNIWDEYPNDQSYVHLDDNSFLILQANGTYYFDYGDDSITYKQIGKSMHVAIADDVKVYDNYSPYVSNRDLDSATLYIGLAEFDTYLNSDLAWYAPQLHAVVKDGKITEIFINPAQHEPWKDNI